MIRTTPPARSTWHQVPPGEIHYGTFTDVYGFEMRPGWAYRCGLCPQVGVGYRTARSTLQGARKHRDEHCGMRIVALPSTARSATLAETWDPLAETWDSEGLETVTNEDDLRTSPRDVPVRDGMH